MTKFHMDLNKCKRRTARGKKQLDYLDYYYFDSLGYALKDCAVHYVMKTNPDVFAKHGLTWDGDEKSYCHVRIFLNKHSNLSLNKS